MKLSKLFARGVTAIALASLAQGAAAQLNYTTSWIGNSFGYGDGKWIQQDIQAIFVAPNSTVYTNSGWDESGAEIAAYRNGDRIAFANNTHGWGAGGGDAITANSTYVYAAMSIGNQNNTLSGADFPPANYTWYGITRRSVVDISQGAPFTGGVGNSANASKNSFLIVETVPSTKDAGIRGLVANDSELFVSDPYRNQILVFDAQTMRRKRIFAVPSPGHLALDRDGSLWVITGALQGQGKLAHYSSTGALLGGTPTLPAGKVPADITVSPSGNLYVADIGPAQQILGYTKMSTGMPQALPPIGTVYGLDHPTPGVIAAGRFNFITGIGFDAAGNLYVGQNGEGPRPLNSATVGAGAVLQAFKGTSRGIAWELDGLAFVDSATFDPGAPNTVYTGSKIFTMDWSKPPGRQWIYAAYTVDRLGFPDDPSLCLGRMVRGEPMVRRLNGNRPYLFTLDPYSHQLYVYRFDAAHGNIAIPSGMFAEGVINGGFPANQPTYGEWMWRDINGDGHLDANEFTGNPVTGARVGNSFIWVDSVGSVWFGTPTSGIRQMPVQSFNSLGNLVYSYASSRSFAMPAPFTRIGRVLYVPETDTMYVSGFTQSIPYDSARWKEAGPTLARYDNWTKGTPVMTWCIALPWNLNVKPIATPVGIAQAGHYVFVAELFT